MLKFVKVMVLLSTVFLGADEEIAFEECEEQPVCHPHCHYRRHPTPEEEYLWQERANSSWPGKRDDNLIDEFLHQ